ncbi:MAG TPA: serine O-acetyltransferase [Candidatus Didemnitutus sp.]|nr:serine O-acetyltransferase [Candidatus Didemnitutus sp.]
MNPDALKQALLESYATGGGINHLDGANLPSQDRVNELARDCMHLLFPGFFEETTMKQSEAADWLGRLLAKIDHRLLVEIEKCLHFAKDADSSANARRLTSEVLGRLPEIRRVVQTDVAAAFSGDPAARSVDEIILAYPCVLAISLQRIAHVLYTLKIPLLPRMLTEYAHERTGIDLHPGADIGPYFFIDHGTGVVIGETATIGSHVKIYQGVTLGAKSFDTDSTGNPIKGIKRHPDIEDHVTIYAHATILGGETRIGAHSVVGASVWLIESIPSHSVAYYKDTSLVVRPRKAHEMVLDGADWSI